MLYEVITQNPLLYGNVGTQVDGYQISESARLVDAVDHLQHIPRQRPAISQRDLEQGIDALHQSFCHQPVARFVVEEFDLYQRPGSYNFV